MGHWFHFAQPMFATFREDGEINRVMVLAWRPLMDDEADNPWDVYAIEYLTDLGDKINPLSEIEWTL